MKFIDLAKSRYSCRKYTPRQVDDETLNQLLEAGRVAPSAANFQPWKIYVFTGGEIRKKVNSVYHREWMAQAPVLLLLCGDKRKAWVRSFDSKNHVDIDVAIIADHITLQATDLGLATCWICHFDVQHCREILSLPEHLEPMVLMPVGYPSDSPVTDRHKTARKPLNEIVVWAK